MYGHKLMNGLITRGHRPVATVHVQAHLSLTHNAIMGTGEDGVQQVRQTQGAMADDTLAEEGAKVGPLSSTAGAQNLQNTILH